MASVESNDDFHLDNQSTPSDKFIFYPYAALACIKVLTGYLFQDVEIDQYPFER